MVDSRVKKLAEILVYHSTKVKKGDKVAKGTRLLEMEEIKDRPQK